MNRFIGTTGFKRISQIAKHLYYGALLDGAPDLFASFDAFDDSGIPQESQMPRNHRHVDIASLCDIADCAWTPSLGQPRKE
jgi:hypothetical protein